MDIGGFALPGYNENSSHQLNVLTATTDVFEESLNHIASTFLDSDISIIDYGSSEGLNSMIYFQKILSKFRQHSQSTINIIHNDLPDNNWIRFFKTITESQNSYISIPDVYFSAIGRSFYSQIVPNNSIQIAFSSLALHFISQNISAPDHIVLSASKDSEFKALASNIAHQDLVNFLKFRHSELVKSGRLILQFVGDDIVNGLVKYNQIVSEILSDKGIITEKEKRDLTLGIYGRTTGEVDRALDVCQDLFTVIVRRSSEFHRFLEENITKEESSIKLVSVLNMVIRNPLKRALKRSNEEIEEILDQFAAEAEKLIRDYQNEATTYHLIVLEKS